MNFSSKFIINFKLKYSFKINAIFKIRTLVIILIPINLSLEYKTIYYQGILICWLNLMVKPNIFFIINISKVLFKNFRYFRNQLFISNIIIIFNYLFKMISFIFKGPLNTKFLSFFFLTQL